MVRALFVTSVFGGAIVILSVAFNALWRVIVRRADRDFADV